MEIGLKINELIDRLGYNKSTFAIQVGVSQPIITHITTGRNKPGLDVIQRILTNCPEVNPEWLLLDRGEMLLNNQLNKKIISDLLSDIKTSIIEVEDKLKTLNEKHELLDKLVNK